MPRGVSDMVATATGEMRVAQTRGEGYGVRREVGWEIRDLVRCPGGQEVSGLVW